MIGDIIAAFLTKFAEKWAEYIQGIVTTGKELQRKFNFLRAKALDVDEQIRNGERSGKKKRKHEVKQWLAEVQTLETEIGEFLNGMEARGFISRFFGTGGQATNLMERVNELLKQHQHFHELLHDVCGTERVPFLGKMLVGENFEKYLDKIWKSLEIDEVSSIGIQGMGGIGKTSMAKNIYNRLVDKPGESVFWITVSQIFSIKRLQDEIARHLRVDLSDESNEEQRAARLNRALSQKKSFVLILDDVRKNINLEKVGNPLSLKGGKLIITTRSKNVCSQIGCQEVVHVSTLSKREAWKLFKNKLGEKVEERLSKYCDFN